MRVVFNTHFVSFRLINYENIQFFNGFMLSFNFDRQKNLQGQPFLFLVNFWLNVNQPQVGGLNLTRNQPWLKLTKVLYNHLTKL